MAKTKTTAKRGRPSKAVTTKKTTKAAVDTKTRTKKTTKTIAPKKATKKTPLKKASAKKITAKKVTATKKPKQTIKKAITTADISKNLQKTLTQEATTLGKTATTLAKKLVKLEKQLNKSTTALTKAEDKKIKATQKVEQQKSKATVAQLKKTSSAVAKLEKTHNALQSELTDLSTVSTSTSAEFDKLKGFIQHIAEFETTWSEKNTAAPAKYKKKAAKKSRTNIIDDSNVIVIEAVSSPDHIPSLEEIFQEPSILDTDFTEEESTEEKELIDETELG